MSEREVFHEGEIAVQQRAGERAIAQRVGAMLGERIMAGALPFLAAQRMLAVASVDAQSRVWTSLWFGPPGFVQSDAEGGRVQIVAQGTSPDDPVLGLLRPGHRVGLLAIELETRKRLRVNGSVSDRRGDSLQVRVEEAFPNCPKYIQRRHRTDRAGGEQRGAPGLRSRARGRASTARGERLDTVQRALVARVDTAFVGSFHPTRGVDVSHRGGQPGFIRVADERTLRFPDYPGNSMFQTLGNLTVNPRAGLSLVDFESGRLLSLTGTAATSFGADDPQQPSGGTGRYWTFSLEQWVELALPPDVGWELIERSRFNPELPPGAP